MSSLMRMLSIGKEKRQPPPVRDVEAIKKSISGPRALAPKHVIDARIEAQKAKRIADGERQRKVSTSPSLAQPSPASVQKHRKTSQAALKKQFKVVFAERPKALPATPTASTHAFGNPDMVTQKRENFINVALNRKSAASSLWCCAGPDGQDSSDQTEMPTSQSNNNIIREVVKDGLVLFFRNEQERRDACRIIATLRESFYDNEPDEPSVLRCGRDCPQCLSQMASRRNASAFSNNRSTENVVIRVIEDPEDAAAAEDQGEKRMSDADIEVFVIDAFESSLHEWAIPRDI